MGKINWKRMGVHLLFPPLWLLIPLTIAAAVLLIGGATVWAEKAVLVYTSYGLSAYALSAVCFRIPRIIRFIKRVKRENAYLVRWSRDVRYRTRLSLFGSLAFSAAYAIFQLGLALYHHSVWFFSFFVYYMLLSVMRYSLLRHIRSAGAGTPALKQEYIRYRRCAYLLLLMNVTLGGIVLYITRFHYGISHHAITTIAMAAYTFYALTTAIVSFVRDRKREGNSPTLAAARVIRLASAAVSMLTLETAMLSAFGDGTDTVLWQWMTASYGTAVCGFVALAAVCMIVHAGRQLKKFREMNDHE